MVAKFLDHNNREFLQKQKSNKFRMAKEQLCSCIKLFCTFLNGSCTTATWTFEISLARFIQQVSTTRVGRKFWSRWLGCQSKRPALEALLSTKGARLLGVLGACSAAKFLYLDTLKCCFLHSPSYFFSKITENPKKNYALYLPILLVNSDISFKKCLP